MLPLTDAPFRVDFRKNLVPGFCVRNRRPIATNRLFPLNELLYFVGIEMLKYACRIKSR